MFYLHVLLIVLSAKELTFSLEEDVGGGLLEWKPENCRKMKTYL